MKKLRLLGAVCACALSFNSLTVHAVAVSGQGTWESTLQGRDMDGNLSTFEAYYDTVQDITWLADANYAQTSGFHASGRMTWWTTYYSWIAGLNINGITGWRFPSTLQPDSSCEWQGGFGSSGMNCTGSEMGHMYYNVLGNTAGSKTNTGPFSNLQSSGYWSHQHTYGRSSWTFNFGIGYQTIRDNTELFPPIVTQYAWAVHSGDVGVPVEVITIDIKPGSDPVNPVNSKSKGVIPVAVLGSMDFDATQVDFSTVEFGPGKASPVHDGHVENVNGDGFEDMVFHFNTQGTGITCGDTEATLLGETFGGDAFSGTDSVKTARCK